MIKHILSLARRRRRSLVSETLTSAPTGRQAIQSTNVFVDANGIV